MKLVYLILIFCMAACTLPSEDTKTISLPQGEGRLVVEVTGIRNNSGEIYLSLFSGPRGFPDDPGAAIVNRHKAIVDGYCRIEIDNLPYGDYAVSLLHDENLDSRMNSNMLGIPKEGFGFSGNPKTKLGPPEYDDVRFLFLVQEKKISVSLQYETVGRERQRIMQERKNQ